MALVGQLAAGMTIAAALDAAARQLCLTNAAGRPLRFVPQQQLPPGTAYEAHIHATGEVPTRENLHDFLNGLIWLHFPHAKAALNRLQSEAITRDGVGARRGPVRDAATLFDENGVLFVATEDEWEQRLRAFQWRALFVERRAGWHAQCAVVPFGHALLEKLVQPYKSITAHAWPIRAAAGAAPATLDLPLAAALRADTLLPAALSPLPVLGIPGWSPDNAMPDFYDDTAVFRPGRRQRC